MGKHIDLDWDKCIGNGMCAAIAPKYFEIDNDGELELRRIAIDPEDANDIEMAIISCPVGAIGSTKTAKTGDTN